MSSPEGSTYAPDRRELERLFVNNASLEKIDAYLGRFNPIAVMKMERMEIRHSAILSWLLDPNETHGLRDRFLKAFLSDALLDHPHPEALNAPTALSVSQSDLRDAEVRREWQNIDIFVLCPRNNWAFVIENKIDSRQHDGQLKKYVSKIRGLFKGQSQIPYVQGIFLTLTDETPQDKGYAPIKYRSICEILSRFIETESARMTTEVAIFLRHYLEILRDATGMSDERNKMEKLARQLYRDHKKVLDFVIQHGTSSDFALAVKSLVGDNPNHLELVKVGDQEIRFCDLNNRILSFLPNSWHNAFGENKYKWKGCEQWWHGYPMICWFEIWPGDDGTKGKLRLNAEVGPLEEYEFRKELIDVISNVESTNISFQRTATDEGKKYSKFLKSNGRDINDIQDYDEIADSMKKLLKKFSADFEKVGRILPQFLHFGEKKSD